MVETSTTLIWSGRMPAFSIASREAVVARSTACTSAEARRRSMMPVRWRIHSSEELIGSISSSFGTTRSPRAAPMPRIRV